MFCASNITQAKERGRHFQSGLGKTFQIILYVFLDAMQSKDLPPGAAAPAGPGPGEGGGEPARPGHQEADGPRGDQVPTAALGAP